MSESEPPVSEAPVDDSEKSISAEKRAEICQNVASAACESCAAAGICPILALRSPNPDDPGRKPATPENLLADDKEGEESVIFVAPELIQQTPIVEQTHPNAVAIPKKNNQVLPKQPVIILSKSTQPAVDKVSVVEPEVEIATFLPQELPQSVKDISHADQVSIEPAVPLKNTTVETLVVLSNDPEYSDHIPKVPTLSKSIKEDEPHVSYEPRRLSRPPEPSMSVEPAESPKATKPPKISKPILKPVEIAKPAKPVDLSEPFGKPKSQQIHIDKPNKTSPTEIISPTPSINPEPIPTATLSIESIPYIKQTVYQSVSPEEELQELFSESTKPLPDNIYPIEPKQPGTDSLQYIEPDKLLYPVEQQTASVSTISTIEQPKLTTLDIPEILLVYPLQTDPQVETQTQVSAPTQTSIQYLAPTPTEVQIESVAQTDSRPVSRSIAQPDFQLSPQPISNTDVQIETTKEEPDDVVVKTTPFHVSQTTPDVALSYVSTLDIAVHPTFTDSQTEAELDATISVCDNEQTEPTTSGYGKSNWLSGLSEVIGRLACVTVQFEFNLSKSFAHNNLSAC